ncbi:tyrosine-type recombinase/integrase [Pseudomonas guariconensis]|uniref:tyrosine-type recombinase/integrase n=1 Tax=Pseudomonas guariconensis TaxID=1288410 RepID=UPI0025A9F705|nr:site-specific integrase [Pseudomonas guariconensis]MDM9594671.1 site-specific integrase [Pseudomonas guariconensis]MDM9607501.1 site-specific integrase [Pseudomonas guariconensis]
MTNTAAVKISDAEIRRQAAGQVRDLRALGNHGLYFRFHRSRERGSWYLIHKGKWNLIGSYPELSAAKVAAALPDIRLRLEAGEGSSLSSWVLTGELLAWFAERMSRDRNLSGKRKSTAASAIKQHLVPRLGQIPLAQIDKALLDRELMWPLQESLSIDYVRLVYQLLALAFRQAFKLEKISTNPMAGIRFGDFSKAKVTVKPSRLRGVHLEQLVARLLSTLAQNPQHGVLALMMLFHGTRLAETRMARWSHISLAEREWFIPAEHTKTRVQHRLPLTAQVCAVLMAYREIQRSEGYDGQFLFPGRKGKPLGEVQAWMVFEAISEGEWTSHDLRKLARTCWADLGVDHLVGELLVNHAMGHNVKVYIQSDMMARKREALEKWHAHLDQKGFTMIRGLTRFRSVDSGNSAEALQSAGCGDISESTISEDSKR